LVAAGIEAVSEGDFSASSNATSLVLKTGASEAATEKLRVTSAGDVGIGDTPSAGVRLDVADTGATAARIRTSDNSDIQFTFFSNGTTPTHSLFFGDSGNSAGAGIRYFHNGDAFTFTGKGSGAEMARFNSSGDLSVGSTSNHAGAKVVINDQPPTAFGSPMFQVGQELFTGSGMYSIGFGYTASGSDKPPVEIAALTTTDGGSTKADIVFGTRNVTTNTAVTERMRLDSNGQIMIQGSATAFDTTAAKNGLQAHYETDTGIATLGSYSSGGSTLITFHTNSGGGASVERMRIAASGAVSVTGALSKGSGSFKIDHPLEAKKDTHHLVHSFIEGPQADLIYRGKLDLVDGSATVNLDDAARMSAGTFVLLNTNVQCFTSNESGWVAVKGSVSGNVLTITSQESCTDTVSWMVVGERCDQHMLDTEWTDSNGRVIVEPLKGE